MPIFELIAIHAASGERVRVTFPEKPDTCVICGAKIDARAVFGWIKGESWGYDRVLEVVFACPHGKCGHLFVAYYSPFNSHDDYFGIKRTMLPVELEWREFPKSIRELSPSFVKIWNEAHLADSNKLSQVCGAGYRKALEFLVKDYLSKRFPAQAEEIRREFLGTSIRRVPDETIRQMAERAAWLGNDESHYVRLWDDKDVSHLKELIEVVVNLIDSAQRAAEYLRDMPSKRDSG